MLNKQSEALQLAELLDRGQHPVLVERKNAASELRRLHNAELDYQQWISKTEWVQSSAQPKELGMHRADAIKQRLDELTTQRDKLLEFVMDWLEQQGTDENYMVLKARVAIAKATGETK